MTVSPLELNRKILQLNSDLESGDADVQTIALAALAVATAAVSLAAPPTEVSISESGPVNEGIWQYADTNGDGTGTKEAIGNYSLGEGIFFITPPAGQIYRINRMLISIEDGVNSVRWDRYGGQAALGTGVVVRMRRGSTLVKEFTNGIPVTKNALWGANCYDAEAKVVGGGNDFFQARWTFGKSGTPVRLVGDEGDKLEVVFNDNLSAITSHLFKFDGEIES